MWLQNISHSTLHTHNKFTEIGNAKLNWFAIPELVWSPHFKHGPSLPSSFLPWLSASIHMPILAVTLKKILCQRHKVAWPGTGLSVHVPGCHNRMPSCQAQAGLPQFCYCSCPDARTYAAGEWRWPWCWNIDMYTWNCKTCVTKDLGCLLCWMRD